jgi:hypothetical protein
MPDRFGVPELMFGPVPDDFYSLVGRIALVSTLLEDRVLGLLWALDDESQPTHAGRPASQIAAEIDARLVKHAAHLGEDLVSRIRKSLEEVSAALEQRHALIHSLWPNPTAEHAEGWRSRRLHKSLGGGSEIVWTKTSVEMLEKDLRQLVRLVDAVLAVTNKVWACRSRCRAYVVDLMASRRDMPRPLTLPTPANRNAH